MRSDLNKQLCERERAGSYKSFRTKRRSKKHNPAFGEDGENVGSHESMTHRYSGGTKEFNENLNPLWGAVRKAVGRPWAKFYSELCQNFDKRSVINQHIIQHLEDRVAIRCSVRDGEIWVDGRYGGPVPLNGGFLSYEYFVDPTDGILKLNKKYKTYRQGRKARAEAEAAAEAAKTRWIDNDNVLRCIDGNWFHFSLARVPRGYWEYKKPEGQDMFKPRWGTKERTWDQLSQNEKERYGVRSFIGEKVVDLFTYTTLFDDNHGNAPKYYHATKKTASHKELKQAGVIT